MTVNEIYMLLGNMLNASVGVKYKEAYLEVERITASVTFSGFYLDAQDKKTPIDELLLTNKMYDAIHELHTITTKGGNNKWNNLLLTLQPTGKFGIDFINNEELEEELAFYKAGGKPQEWLAKKRN